VLSTCEGIIAILRDASLESQSTPHALNNIAAQLDVPRKDIDFAVVYMLGAPIFGGWTSIFANEEASMRQLLPTGRFRLRKAASSHRTSAD
jgi:hypothetical protein